MRQFRAYERDFMFLNTILECQKYGKLSWNLNECWSLNNVRMQTAQLMITCHQTVYQMFPGRVHLGREGFLQQLLFVVDSAQSPVVSVLGGQRAQNVSPFCSSSLHHPITDPSLSARLCFGSLFISWLLFVHLFVFTQSIKSKQFPQLFNNFL